MLCLDSVLSSDIEIKKVFKFICDGLGSQEKRPLLSINILEEALGIEYL